MTGVVSWIHTQLEPTLVYKTSQNHVTLKFIILMLEFHNYFSLQRVRESNDRNVKEMTETSRYLPIHCRGPAANGINAYGCLF